VWDIKRNDQALCGVDPHAVPPFSGGNHAPPLIRWKLGTRCRVGRFSLGSYHGRRPVVKKHPAVAEQLDGSYVLKTDRQDLTAEEIWRASIPLTRVEGAFRAMKSPLMERPIFHHLEHRTQTHICLCVLAYHLLVAIEKRFLDQGIHASWGTLREQLSTHQVATVVLPMTDGPVLKVREGGTPEPIHRETYSTLQIPMQIMKPIKTWHAPAHSDGTNS
jgi:hypothetical protein